jgi:AraC-like DNA-binding protein
MLQSLLVDRFLISRQAYHAGLSDSEQFLPSRAFHRVVLMWHTLAMDGMIEYQIQHKEHL